MLPLALLTLVIVEAAAMLALLAGAVRDRILFDRRITIEAELALTTATTRARLAGDSAMAQMAPGAHIVIAVPPIAGWETTASAVRHDSTRLAALEVWVLKRDARGDPVVQRRATLLLSVGTADTAIVLSDRPLW